MSESIHRPENVEEILKKLCAITAELSRDGGEASVDEAAVKQRLVDDSDGAITQDILNHLHLVRVTVNDRNVEGHLAMGNALKFNGVINVASWTGNSDGWLNHWLSSGQMNLNLGNLRPPQGDQLSIHFFQGSGALVAMYRGSPLNDGGVVPQGTGVGNLFD
ncbi:hypothetical protein PsYK624_088000 [Phanerochaete sordida]|uniref:Uncharacterized protein n=1 Tax=Phanerochaete sordida TaxID=48140 RepID=A0A9P3GDB6_9APHY|nr:hypothetical protein PsYK624_088000 [Phanerochaete sordida]